MSHFELSENYYHRKCYIKREQVPTQTVMKDKMRELAPVYFNSMTYRLKVLAGLEPPLKGGGSDWFQPPSEILKSRHVLQPVDHDHLKKLSCDGINQFGSYVAMAHMKTMEREKMEALSENDSHWRKIISDTCAQQWQETAAALTKRNTERILKTFNEFTYIYVRSISKLEELLQNSAVKEITTSDELTQQRMEARYRIMLKYQATELYDKYITRFNAKKEKLKAKFLEDLYLVHKERSDRVHELNYQKHVAVEKLRNLLECQKLAAQIYVAHKERQECSKEEELATHEFDKKVKTMDDQIAFQDFEIKLETEQEMKRQMFEEEWKRKIRQVVKKFQLFVQYCFNLVPQYAEFFINMEKLMMLQLSEASENPSAESIIEPVPEWKPPDPHPHPHFFFREGGPYPKFERHLCPKHCTSSASQLPVVVFGNRCMYAACDNLEQFTEKVNSFIAGKRGDDADVQDFHDYSFNLPIRVTESDQLQEIKNQGSLMRILQQEYPNVHKVQTICCPCDIPHCFCSPLHPSQQTSEAPSPQKPPSLHSLPSGSKIETRDAELKHYREPKWESYMEFIHTKKCVCPKTAKKHLMEHLPAYMRIRSKFEEVEIPNYKPCSVRELKQMVRKAKGKRPPPPPPPPSPPKRNKDAFTQYEDIEFEHLCECFQEEELEKLFKGSRFYQALRLSKFDTTDGALSKTHLEQTVSKFALDQAFTLRNILNDEPQLKEIFMSQKYRNNQKE